jgi:hypothetical protein
MNSFLRRIDTILLVIISIIALTVAALDFAHVISDKELNPAVPALTLVFLSLLAVHLIVSHVVAEDFQKHSTELLERISRGISLGEFRLFADAAEMEHYLSKRVAEAKKSVCDLSWKSKISAEFAAGHRQLSHGSLDRSITEASASISYREIFVFNDRRRIEKLERRLAEKNDGYSCRYFKDDTRIPRLQFVIIDDEEVFFFATSPHSQLCATRSPELCRVFKPYFDEAWNHANPIKEGQTVHENEVEKIRKLFES